MSKRPIHSLVLAAATMFCSLAMAAGDQAGNPGVERGEPGKTRAQAADAIAFKSDQDAGDWQKVDWEAGWVYVGSSRVGKSREEVVRELEAFQRDAAAQARHDVLYGGH